MFNNDNMSSDEQVDALIKYGKIAAGVVIAGFLTFGAISQAINDDNSFITKTLTSIGASNFVDSTKSKHLNKILEQTNDFYNKSEIDLQGSFYSMVTRPIFIDVSEDKKIDILEDLFVNGKLSNIITAEGTLGDLYQKAPEDIKKLIVSSIIEAEYKYTSAKHRQRYTVKIDTQRIKTLLNVNDNISDKIADYQDKIVKLDSHQVDIKKI